MSHWNMRAVERIRCWSGVVINMKPLEVIKRADKRNRRYQSSHLLIFMLNVIFCIDPFLNKIGVLSNLIPQQTAFNWPSSCVPPPKICFPMTSKVLVCYLIHFFHIWTCNAADQGNPDPWTLVQIVAHRYQPATLAKEKVFLHKLVL